MELLFLFKKSSPVLTIFVLNTFPELLQIGRSNCVKVGWGFVFNFFNERVRTFHRFFASSWLLKIERVLTRLSSQIPAILFLV